MFFRKSICLGTSRVYIKKKNIFLETGVNNTFIGRDFVHYHGVVENCVSCTVRCTIVATAMENLAACVIEE
jgi:predicted PhzF superfamily epimerase YddE/YHI9